MRITLRSKLIIFILMLTVVSTVLIYTYSRGQFKGQIDAYTKENTLTPIRSAKPYIKGVFEKSYFAVRRLEETKVQERVNKLQDVIEADSSFVIVGYKNKNEPNPIYVFNQGFVNAVGENSESITKPIVDEVLELGSALQSGTEEIFNISTTSCYCGTLIRSDDTSIFFTVVTFDYILDALKSFEKTPMALINQHGGVIFHTDRSQMLEKRNLKDLGITQRALEKNAPAIASLEFVQNEEQMVGSFAKIGLLELTLISFSSKQQAYLPIFRYEFVLKMFVGILILLAIIMTIFISNAITYPLKDLTEATEEIRKGNFGVSVDIETKDELKDLGDAFNLMSSEITKLMLETAQKAALDKELETASAVQNTLIPGENFNDEVVTIGAKYISAAQCGGDWWSVYKLPDTRLIIMIADATGHGVGSALVTAAANSAASIITYKARVNSSTVCSNTILEEINYAIYNASKGQINMTFFVAIVDPINKVIQYSNASHNVPYLLKKSLFEKSQDKKALKPLTGATGDICGLRLDSTYEADKITYETGDVLFLG